MCSFSLKTGAVFVVRVRVRVRVRACLFVVFIFHSQVFSQFLRVHLTLSLPKVNLTNPPPPKKKK